MFEAQLKDVPFFSRLSKRELATVARKADEVDVKQGEVVAREGDFGQEFFVIIDGTAEVLRDDAPIAELGPGEFFGEMALLDEERRTATVRAISPMRVLVMTRQNFRDIDRSMPAGPRERWSTRSDARRAMLQAAWRPAEPLAPAVGGAAEGALARRVLAVVHGERRSERGEDDDAEDHPVAPRVRAADDQVPEPRDQSGHRQGLHNGAAAHDTPHSLIRWTCPTLSEERR